MHLLAPKKSNEHWLIKLDGVSDAQFGETSGWGRVEYAYYLMAKACGIEMSAVIKNWKDFAAQASARDKLAQRVDDQLHKSNFANFGQ
ncbi:MAG: hypothetical protein Q8914_04640 [Bacteroidota bacterium]|nr:hypothetical protein [Bacteroidota bacterium]